MSPDVVRAVVLPVSLALLVWAQSLQFRDRARRERELRERPQPMQHTRWSRGLLALASVGIAVSAITIFL